jgi:hypothetical protein
MSDEISTLDWGVFLVHSSVLTRAEKISLLRAIVKEIETLKQAKRNHEADH